MTNYFLDTEFIEEDCIPISIGICNDKDDREFYAEFDIRYLTYNDFIADNVVPKLAGPTMRVHEIRSWLTEYVGDATDAKFWADCGTYDWMIVFKIFGGWNGFPPTWPHIFWDIRHLTNGLELPEFQTDATRHHALCDARELRSQYAWLKTQES